MGIKRTLGQSVGKKNEKNISVQKKRNLNFKMIEKKDSNSKKDTNSSFLEKKVKFTKFSVHQIVDKKNGKTNFFHQKKDFECRLENRKSNSFSTKIRKKINQSTKFNTQQTQTTKKKCLNFTFTNPSPSKLTKPIFLRFLIKIVINVLLLIWNKQKKKEEKKTFSL